MRGGASKLLPCRSATGVSVFAHTSVDDVCVAVVEGADPRLVVVRSKLRLHLQEALRAQT